MSKIFFISGLGANELAFAKLGDLGVEKVMIPWIKNERKESLESYAKRLITIHNIQSTDYLAGLSFGGIVAQTIANELGNTSVILISSFRNKSDLKLPFKLALTLGLNKLFIPVKVPIIENVIASVLNSGNKNNRAVLTKMIQLTDYKLMSWSMQKIADFKQPYPNLILHNIIGSKDRILKIWTNKTSFIVEGGSHFMVHDSASDITKVIQSILDKE